jgi:dihydrofolate reductase
MTVSLIAAVAENLVIGAGGKMPWHLPADLRHFKSLTLGTPILMGRKTYESIGKVLPGRHNIIVSHNEAYTVPDTNTDVSVVSSLAAGIELALGLGAKQVFLIGGGQLYRQALEQNLVDLIYLTRVHHNFNGDVYFPSLRQNQWQKVAERLNNADTENKYSFSFETWIPVVAA